jgi:hypothetical protein
MDDFIGRLAARSGVERAVAQTAVGITVEFPPNAGPAQKAQRRYSVALHRHCNAGIERGREAVGYARPVSGNHARSYKRFTRKCRGRCNRRIVGMSPGLGQYV